MKALLFLLALASALPLAACSGTDIRDDQELENMPLREASKDEASRLKLCLRAVAHVQMKRYEQLGSYYERARDLPTKKYCKAIKLQLDTAGSTYEATGIVHDDDYAVRWTINQANVMEEQTDPAMNDVDFE